MTNTTNTPADDSNALSATVTTTGIASPTSYAIDPEHQHHADAIRAMDPMQVPMPFEIPDGFAASLTLKPTALPPVMQNEIAAKLAALGPLSPAVREAKQAELTVAAVRSQRSRLITKIGVGKDATPYHREMAGIAREVSDLHDEHTRLENELAHVVRHDTVIDPATGEPKAVPVYAVMGTRARAYVERQRDLERQIRLLAGEGDGLGIEGQRRVSRAMHESVMARVELQRQVDEEAEAKALAETINRNHRVNARAESLARLRRNGG